MSPHEVLICARWLIQTPEAWTKGCFARNIEGLRVSIRHPHACAFSIEGALYRVQWITKAPISMAYHTMLECITRTKHIPLAHFNDANGTSHSTAIDLYNRAIARFGSVPPLELEG
jgi:hypothetical protein